MKIEQTTNFDEILTFAFNNGTEYNETNDYYINTPYLGFKLLINKKIVGTIVICKSINDDYVLENLAIKKEYRHQGYATLLLEHALNKLIELKIKKVYLIARVYELYEKLGFSFVDDKQYLIDNEYLACELYKNKTCISKVMVRKL